MRTYRDEAIVLRTHKLGEADRIITLLTRDNAQIRAVAKGIRRTSSRFGARLEPFSVVDVQLHKGRTLDTVIQVETIASYGELLAADYELYASAHVLVETAERLTSDGEERTHNQYLLLLGALHSLAYRRHHPRLIVTSYMLRALAIAGWAPSCFDCAMCGAAGPHKSFSIPEGGAVCDDCRPAGALAPSVDAMLLLGDLLSGDWESVKKAKKYAYTEASALVSAYMQWHVERRLQSLKFLESSRMTP
ncbi:DNA repair protein RecO [Schaalia sp. lx-260]|uniref:DNA repair protein RecO n=1 Tax=Schaalia sp. lx-260 TaxID=2899082 RepID=UPI001E5649DF|nr:DNA repair protein RecO [Schaalia sp. lx-260]MCD4549452.1 DNA repair protein RecO [Schaalia sp. lx-260]